MYLNRVQTHAVLLFVSIATQRVANDNEALW